MGGHSSSPPPGYQAQGGGGPPATTGTPIGNIFPGGGEMGHLPFSGAPNDNVTGFPSGGPMSGPNGDILKYLQGIGAHAPNGGPLMQNGQFMPPWMQQGGGGGPGGGGALLGKSFMQDGSTGMPGGPNMMGIPAGEISNGGPNAAGPQMQPGGQVGVPNANTPSTNNYDTAGSLFNKPQQASPSSWMPHILGSSPPMGVQ